MTPEQQQIAIATACGWTSESGVMRYDGEDVPWTVWSKDGKHHRGNCPDYLNDLNACHEMEKMLTIQQAMAYADKLVDMAEDDSLWLFVIAHAPAAQRAEAFLRTLNLWND